jgi:hypothetical protein
MKAWMALMCAAGLLSGCATSTSEPANAPGGVVTVTGLLQHGVLASPKRKSTTCQARSPRNVRSRVIVATTGDATSGCSVYQATQGEIGNSVDEGIVDGRARYQQAIVDRPVERIHHQIWSETGRKRSRRHPA